MVKETSAFVRKLAHNDPVIRKSAFTSLKQYLQSPAGQKLRLIDLEKVWKGLYYSMWYCDKPVPQQGLAGDLGGLFSAVVPQEKLADFHRAFWEVVSREWHSIDKWRIDKYLMLVRRVLRHNLFRLEAHSWPKAEVAEFLQVLQEYPISDNAKFPQSLAYHVCDIFLDEIEYVAYKDVRDYSEENDVDDESDEEEEDEEEDEDDDKDLSEIQTPGTETATTLTEAEIEAKKAKIISKTPVAQLVEPFQKLVSKTRNKALRDRIQEEMLDDARLAKWAVVEKEESESEDEWTGF